MNVSPVARALTTGAIAGPKYRQMVRDEPALMELLQRARDSHEAALAGQQAPGGAR